MITELTKEQAAKVPSYVTRWIQIASQSMDFSEVKKSVLSLYEHVFKKTPMVLSAKGPVHGLWRTLGWAHGFDGETQEEIDAFFQGKKVDTDLKNKVVNSLLFSVYNYDYAGLFEFTKEIGVEYDKKLYDLFVNFFKSTFCLYVFENLVVVCEKPVLHWKVASYGDQFHEPRHVLHCENGPAICFNDGYKLYYLNGIKVPEWVVMTDTGKIDPRKALDEKNVDVQREIIRKIGAERMLKACNATCLDTFIDNHTNDGNEYRLMEMKIDSIDRKYLCYNHASLAGVVYAQPVDPSITKALHARAWMIGVCTLKELGKVSDEEIKKRLPKVVS